MGPELLKKRNLLQLLFEVVLYVKHGDVEFLASRMEGF